MFPSLFYGVTLVRVGDIAAATGDLNQADIDHPEGGKQMRRLLKWHVVLEVKADRSNQLMMRRVRGS